MKPLSLILAAACILAACGPTVEQKEKIAAALEANAEASRRAETAKTALTEWHESQEPDSTAEAWLVFVWESADTGNRRLVRQAQGQATLARGNAATARDNASRAWKMAARKERTRSIVEETADIIYSNMGLLREMGRYEEASAEHAEWLDTNARERAYAAEAEALEWIGNAYGRAAAAFDVEADAWTTLAVFAE